MPAKKKVKPKVERVAKPKPMTVDEAIGMASQLRPDQGKDKLMAFLERLK